MLSILSGKMNVAVAVLTLVIALVGGAVALGVMGTPSVTGVDNRFGDVNETSTVIESDLRVSNPNPFGAALGGLTLDYSVSMNGIRMAHGSKGGVEIERGNSTVPFSTVMDNQKIPAWWASHIRSGESTTLRVDADIHSSLLNRTFGAPTVERTIETDIISQFNSTETRPVNAGAPVVSDPVLYVNETSARWGQVNESTTPIAMDFTMYNPKSYPIPVTEIGYTVTMNNVTVGNGTTDRTYVLSARSERTLQTRTVIDNPTLDEWWVSHLARNQVTDLGIDFYAKVNVGGETVRVPLDEMTYTKTIRTDMFGTKNATADGSDSTDTDASDESSTGTADTTTATETTERAETATPTATPTPSPTTPASSPTSTPSGGGTTTGDGILSVVGA